MSYNDAMMQWCDQNVTPATIATTAMQHSHNVTPTMQHDQDATATDHNTMHYNNHNCDATYGMTIMTVSTSSSSTITVAATLYTVHNHDATATTTAILYDHCNITWCNAPSWALSWPMWSRVRPGFRYWREACTRLGYLQRTEVCCATLGDTRSSPHPSVVALGCLNVRGERGKQSRY